jgi:3-oxoacyl-[acyl-carrier-protein] synthase II
MKRADVQYPGEVAVTGLGLVTPLGIGVEAFWQAVQEGKSAFSPIRVFDSGPHRTHTASGLDVLPYVDLKRLDGSVLSRADVMGVAAAGEALRQARLLDGNRGCVSAPESVGIVGATAAGGILGLEAFFRMRFRGEQVSAPASLLTSFCLSAMAAHVAREFVIRGPRATTATVCSSSGLALAAAFELLISGSAEQVLVIGAESLSEVTHGGFNSLRAVAPDCCRPFDRERAGMVLGEGAGAMVLEPIGSATDRGVPVLARLSGYGFTTDVHHFTAPEPKGDAIAWTMREALCCAGVDPGDVDYINAHGTGTPLNDAAEDLGIKSAFGSAAASLSISSLKSMIGHQLGAASILEAVATVLAVRDGLVPPTANLTTPDPELDLDYTPLHAKRREIRCAVSNSFAFGGSNISLVFRAADSRPAARRSPGERAGAPVITGIGLVTPFGIGKRAFFDAVRAGRSGVASARGLGDEWAPFRAGLVDMEAVRREIPPRRRRHLNRLGAFLTLSVQEALADAGLEAAGLEGAAMTYGSACGCSGNVHAFYTKLLAEGPRAASPQEFMLSVTNAPPALVGQSLGFGGPIWVFVADEASWEASLHWADRLIRNGRAERVVVSAAEEVSGSILAIHEALGFLGRGLVLGEGALTLILESPQSAVARGQSAYGALLRCATAQNAGCGPLDYARGGDALRAAALESLKAVSGNEPALMCLGPAGGVPELELIERAVMKAVSKAFPRVSTPCRLRPLLGESGVAGGFSLAAALLNDGQWMQEDFEGCGVSHALTLTSARGGIQAATLVRIHSRRAFAV